MYKSCKGIHHDAFMGDYAVGPVDRDLKVSINIAADTNSRETGGRCTWVNDTFPRQCSRSRGHCPLR